MLLSGLNVLTDGHHRRVDGVGVDGGEEVLVREINKLERVELMVHLLVTRVRKHWFLDIHDVVYAHNIVRC